MITTPEVGICIATYRRPEGLRRLLHSLARLDPETPGHEIIVVDNEESRTADQIASQAIADGMPVRYLCEPIRSIARARNCAVRATQSDLIAFIDDDEEASPEWLRNLHRGLVSSGADAVFGPVIARFNSTPPVWVEDLGFYKDLTPPTGTALKWHGARAGNALVRRAVLDALPSLFDDKLGREGGEDVDLFARLADTGARLVAVDDAIVFEDVPRARLAPTWMVRRYIRNGGTLQRVVTRGMSWREKVSFALASGWKSLTSLGRALLGSMAGRETGIRELFRSIKYLGVILGFLGIRVKEYDRSR